MTENLNKLTEVLKVRGMIKTARVSSAQARGAAKRYAYWGAVRYQLRLGKDGMPVNVARERATSDRRSLRLAQEDLERMCEAEGRIEVDRIGHLSDRDAERVLKQLG